MFWLNRPNLPNVRFSTTKRETSKHFSLKRYKKKKKEDNNSDNTEAEQQMFAGDTRK